MGTILRSNKTFFLSLLVVTAICAVLGLAMGINMTLMMSRIVIMILFALSLNLQMGYAGLGNMGHALYFGLGGYGMMILVGKMHVPFWAAFFMTIILLTMLSAAFGFLTLQSESLITFLFISFGLCALVSTLFAKWPYVGNTTGLTFNIKPDYLNDPSICYILIMSVTFICVILMYLLIQTPFIMAIKGCRENDQRMVFLGVNIKKLRLVVYILSSCFGIIAGALYTIMNNGAYITSIGVSMALEAMLMCLIGGGLTFYGPIIGAVIVTLITNFLPRITNLDSIILGIVIILCCYFLPNGLSDPNGKIHLFLKKTVSNILAKRKTTEN